MARNLSFFSVIGVATAAPAKKMPIKRLLKSTGPPASKIRSTGPEQENLAAYQHRDTQAVDMMIHRQNGSSLMEVMVSLFVLAIGLMGILAMQVKSIQFGQSADTYSRAMNLANDIAERIRTNPKNVTAYAAEDIPETAPTNCKNGELSAACSASDLVKWDLFNWSETVKNTLPVGTGSIVLKTQGGKTYLQVTVSFDDSRANGTAGPQRKHYSLLVESPTQLGGA